MAASACSPDLQSVGGPTTCCHPSPFFTYLLVDDLSSWPGRGGGHSLRGVLDPNRESDNTVENQTPRVIVPCSGSPSKKSWRQDSNPGWSVFGALKYVPMLPLGVYNCIRPPPQAPHKSHQPPTTYPPGRRPREPCSLGTPGFPTIQPELISKVGTEASQALVWTPRQAVQNNGHCPRIVLPAHLVEEVT